MGAVAILVIAGLFVYGAATNEAYGWDTYLKYLLDERVAEAAWNTLQLTIYAMTIGLVLGVILAVMRLSPNPVFRAVAWGYLWIFRGTPVYVQLVFWGLFPSIYQNIQIGVPFGPSLFHIQLQGLSLAFEMAFIGLGLNEAAYMAEIIRAGIISVPEGQTEASVALGMSWWMTMRRTVLPQAMRVIVPPTGNETISMLKTTSLVFIIPLTSELFFQAGNIGTRLFQPFPMAIMASIWYLALTSVLMVGQYYIERHYAKGAMRDLPPTPFQKLKAKIGIGD